MSSIPPTRTLPDAIETERAASERLDASIKNAVATSNFSAPVSALGLREAWEAVLAMLLGKQALPHGARAAEVPHLVPGRNASQLAADVGETWVKPKWGAKNNPGKRPHIELPDPPRDISKDCKDAFRLSTALVVAGLVAYHKLRKLPESDLAYRLLMWELVGAFLQNPKEPGKAGARICRLAGLYSEDVLSTVPEEKAATAVRDHALALLRGDAETDKDWWAVTISAKRIQTYLDEFHADFLRRGASSLVVDVLAVVRERLIHEYSISCLVSHSGGKLVFMLPVDREESPAVFVRSLAERVSAWLHEDVYGAGREPGYFQRRYPRMMAAVAGRLGDANGQLPPGLRLPPIEIGVVRTSLSEALASNVRPVERSMVTLGAAQDAPSARPCTFCADAEGLPAPPEMGYKTGTLFCAGCLFVAGVGKEARAETVAAMADSFNSDTPFVCSRTRKAVLGKEVRGKNRYVTILLDGQGIGGQMRQFSLLGSSAAGHIFDLDIRSRFFDALAEVGKHLGERSAANSKQPLEKLACPVDVLWLAGDDLCVSIDSLLVTPFLRGFARRPAGRVTYAGAVMLHGATTAEQLRVLRAIRHVEEEAKGQQPPPQRSVLAVQVVRLRELEELATDRSAGPATEGTGVNLHCAEAAGAELQALIARAPR